jgi:hypothetical protein
MSRNCAQPEGSAAPKGLLMPRQASPPPTQAGTPHLEYAVDLFYRAADAALDSDPRRRRESAGLFALAQAVLEAAEQPRAGAAPLAAAVSSPTARLRAGHASGLA